MIFYNGHYSINYFGEGYPEAVLFAIIGLIGLRAVKMRDHVDEVSYDPLV